VALAPALDALARGLAAVMAKGGPVRETIRVLGEQLGRLASYAIAVGAAFMGQFAAGMALAIARTLRLSGALAALRVALIRTGFGALIVAAGEMIHQFSRLVQSTGAFGTAMGLLKDVAVEVWERIKMGAGLLGEEIDLVCMKIKASFAGAFASVLEGWAGMMGAMGFEAGSAGAEAARELANELNTGVAEFGDSLSKSWGAVTAPLASMEALRGAMVETEGAVNGTGDAVEDLGAGLDAVDEKGGKASKSLKKTKETVEKLSEAMRETKETMRSAFSNIVTGAKTVKEALADMLQSFANMVLSNAFDGLWSSVGSGGGVLSGIARSLVLRMARPRLLAVWRWWASGGQSWSICRAVRR
jgi:methyl-accepting chemotaxis protein